MTHTLSAYADTLEILCRVEFYLLTKALALPDDSPDQTSYFDAFEVVRSRFAAIHDAVDDEEEEDDAEDERYLRSVREAEEFARATLSAMSSSELAQFLTQDDEDDFRENDSPMDDPDGGRTRIGNSY